MVNAFLKKIKRTKLRSLALFSLAKKKVLGILVEAQARAWRKIFHWRYKSDKFWVKNANYIIVIPFLTAVAISVYFNAEIQDVFLPFFKGGNGIERLQEAFVNLGSAMLGAAVIVFSLATFSIQVNIERLPHTLFRLLGLDKPLMVAFVAAFGLSVFIIILGITSDISTVGASIVAASWSALIIPIIFVYAYKRTMVIVNPLRQLGFIVFRARKSLSSWNRAFEKVRPLSGNSNFYDGGRVDSARIEFFRQNPLWTTSAKSAVSHVMAMHKGAIDRGDYEIGDAALYALVQINSAYIEAKGRTFFAPNSLLNTSLEIDPFINDTLEHLRRAIAHAKAVQDEIYLSQLLRSFATLADTYRSIDYSGSGVPKYHSHLATGYLIRSLEAIVPLQMTDVLMEGVRLLKIDAISRIRSHDWSAASTNYDSISRIAIAGIINKELQPVCSVCVESFSDIIFELFIARNVDVESVTKNISAKIVNISTLLLPKQDTPLFGDHEMILGVYFSTSDYNGFCAKIRDFANEIINADHGNEHAEDAIDNLVKWSESVPPSHKRIFSLAYSNQSFLTYHLLHWVAHVVEVLMAVAWAPVVRDRERDALFNNSAAMLEIINIRPETEEQSLFLSGFQWEDELFNIASNARRRDCEVVLIRARFLLLEWAFSVGKFRSGTWHFERALLGVVWLSAVDCKERFDESIGKLKSLITKQLMRKDAPSQDLLDTVAGRLRDRAEILPSYDHSYSSIESAFQSLEIETARKMLLFIASSIQRDV